MDMTIVHDLEKIKQAALGIKKRQITALISSKKVVLECWNFLVFPIKLKVLHR